MNELIHFELSDPTASGWRYVLRGDGWTGGNIAMEQFAAAGYLEEQTLDASDAPNSCEMQHSYEVHYRPVHGRTWDDLREMLSLLPTYLAMQEPKR